MVDTPTITKFDPAAAATRARRGVIVALYGATKTGKTHFLTRAPRPLYIVFMDPNANLDAHLLKAHTEGLSYDIETLVVPAKEYDAISQQYAESVVTEIEKFARMARMKAEAAVAAGQEPGTFAVDGMRILKGYYEKAILGESATLGFRPKKGSRAPSPFEYSQSNDALRDLIQGFSGGPLDMLMTWEGRPEWVDTVDDTGRKSARKTGNYRTTQPDAIPFAVQAQIQTTMAVRTKVENNEAVKYVEPEMIFEWNSFNKDLYYRRMPAMDWSMVKGVLLGTVPNAEDVLIPRAEELVRVQGVED